LSGSNSSSENGIGGGLSLPLLPSPEPRRLKGISRRFGDLKVRPKFMVLHNLFFLALACAIYFTLIPLVETRLAEARGREINLIVQNLQALGEEDTGKELRPYDLREGSAAELDVPDDAREWLYSHPGQVWRREEQSDYLYKWRAEIGPFYRLHLPTRFYTGVIESIKIVVFAVLGVAYVLAVLVLELVIMPRYVYQPLRLMLAADAATQRGDNSAEMIGEGYIPGDEIGQIMRSRNKTISDLRKREHDLAHTLDRLETAKRDLESQDRLVSLGLLSASVAHEMNTPLAVLHGSIEKLMETVDAPGAQSRLQRMVRVTERLRKISEGLLDFARVRRREMEPVELRGLIEEAWGLVAIDEKASEIQFQNSVRAGDSIVGNADQLIQVFVNLLRNSLCAVRAGGAICVEARATQVNGAPAFAITVEDNGPGIPPEILPEIFEAFVTTRLDARGTGLGLTVAEGIVTQHGGSISATNCAAGGARLEVILPAAAMPQPVTPNGKRSA
jgi:signal transduction histidine kinase